MGFLQNQNLTLGSSQPEVTHWESAPHLSSAGTVTLPMKSHTSKTDSVALKYNGSGPSKWYYLCQTKILATFTGNVFIFKKCFALH